MKQTTLLILLTLASLGAPDRAEAQCRSSVCQPGSFQLGAGFLMGFGGGSSIGDASVDLAPTFGVHVQGLVPIGDYLLVGGDLSLRSMKRDIPLVDLGRVNVFGIDVAFGGHYNIELGGMSLDPFVVLTLGLGVSGRGEDVDSRAGLDFGGEGGANLWFTDTLGVSLSLGYKTMIMFEDPENVKIGQFTMSIGVSMRL